MKRWGSRGRERAGRERSREREHSGLRIFSGTRPVPLQNIRVEGLEERIKPSAAE